MSGCKDFRPGSPDVGAVRDRVGDSRVHDDELEKEEENREVENPTPLVAMHHRDGAYHRRYRFLDAHDDGHRNTVTNYHHPMMICHRDPSDGPANKQNEENI